MTTIHRPFLDAARWRASCAAIASAAGALIFPATLWMAHATAHAAAPVIYPARDQSATQQDQDKYQCHAWARQQSGYDPLQPAAPANGGATANAGATPGTSANAGAQSAAGGMAKGAAVGAAVGEIARDDAGRGAAVGLLGGAMLQSVKQRQAAQAQQQQQQQQQQLQQQQAAQQQAARHQQQATFERAFGACMEARGYVVK